MKLECAKMMERHLFVRLERQTNNWRLKRQNLCVTIAPYVVRA